MKNIPIVALDSEPSTIKMAQVNGKFYVRLMAGHYQNLRRWLSWPLMAAFFLVVWLPWDGHPAVLFSSQERRIFLFGLNLSWHDLPLLSGMLIAAAALLFFTAVAWGRVWCGFACPQSVWTWLFIRIEHLIEGDARVVRKRESRGLSVTDWLRRGVKHGVWMVVALATAATFSGYFVPVRELTAELVLLEFGSGVWLWVIIMAALTYANAGLVREKICLHACPYSRFQSVMFDLDTRTVSYDVARGEPRISARRQSSSGGDCVDCSLCVQVCPTGIDIRDGLQAACIDCGACIDACDGVMTRLERPPGLIRFASERQLQGQSSPLFRGRLLGYGAIALMAVGAVIWGFTQTTAMVVEVRRDRTELFSIRPDDTVCNDYRLKVEGFVPGQTLVQVIVRELVAVGADEGQFELLGPEGIDLAQSQASWQNYRVCALNPAQGKTRLQFEFRLGKHISTRNSTFLVGRH
ncbi:cytochrome c oxidase accessory protein CcoG [Oceanobacter antarcticus]|uniref:Cytochrome c oxidase accessory protein CcoG n=1 Tax=Oceanobacter antarcticus TaxID=3133425 RepID=A0ABW8NI05_9GAMM